MSTGALRRFAPAVVLTAGVLTSAVGCSDEDSAPIVLADERVAEGPCSGDDSKLVDRVRVDDLTIVVWQTDAGVVDGVASRAEFAAAASRCVGELAPWLTDALADHERAASCEMWLHNLATYPLVEDDPLSSRLSNIDAISSLLHHGRPIDMDVRVWRGERSGRPWDGRESVCRVVAAAVPGDNS